MRNTSKIIAKPKVSVLLAAYNGELFIEDQIKSILQQRNVELSLFISVDKSKDNTIKICQKYKGNNVEILPYGDNFGNAAKNFYRLIQYIKPSQFDFVSFSDQDDIWNSDKLNYSINEIINQKSEGFSSNVIAFWESSRRKLVKKDQPQRKYDHFFEAAGPGCT